jgi:DNA polymerase
VIEIDFSHYNETAGTPGAVPVTVPVAEFVEKVEDGRPMLYVLPLYGEIQACNLCGCRAEAKRPVPGHGPVGAEIVFIGQNPGNEEDEAGLPFVGRSGTELDGWLKVLGFLRENVVITNMVKCHTKDNRPPRPSEVATCRNEWLAKELGALASARVLIPIGKPALTGIADLKTPRVLEPFWFDVKMGERPFHVVPLAHPAYILRKPETRKLMEEVTLPAVRDHLMKEFPEVYVRATHADGHRR